MLRFVFSAVMAAFLCAPSAAAACTDFDRLVSIFESTGVSMQVFSEKELPAVISTLEGTAGRDLAGATRALIVATSAEVIVGVEINGCTLDPIVVAKPKAPRLSGKDAAGRIGA